MTLREELRLFASHAWGEKSETNWLFNIIVFPATGTLWLLWFLVNFVLVGRKLDG